MDQSLAIALVVVGVIAAGGLVGLALQRVLPERYTMDKARDMIGGVVGQLTLLLVLVNGLLIWTAYGVYSTQQTELQTLAARALEFDLEMRQYGPQADEGRSILRTRSRLGARAVLGRRQLARRGLRGLLQGDEQYEQVPRRPRAQDARADEPALRRARELRLHRRAAAPHVASGDDPGPLAYGLRRDLLVLRHVRQHGASVEIEPDVGCDAHSGQRLDRACDLS